MRVAAVQEDIGGGGWPGQVPAGQMTVRDPNNNGGYRSDMRSFEDTFQWRQPGLANSVINLLTAGDWDCLYNS